MADKVSMKFAITLFNLLLFYAVNLKCFHSNKNDNFYLENHPKFVQDILNNYDTNKMIFTFDSTFDVNFDGINDYIINYRYYDASTGCLGFMSDMFLSNNKAYVKDTLLENLCNINIDLKNKRLSSLYIDRNLNGYSEVFIWDKVSYKKEYFIRYEPTDDQRFITKIFNSNGKLICTRLKQSILNGTELIAKF